MDWLTIENWKRNLRKRSDWLKREQQIESKQSTEEGWDEETYAVADEPETVSEL